jgi:ArsR family transcriptional regulator, arsenate/arsenite/antimonite-responsive transcriptional repressor
MAEILELAEHKRGVRCCEGDADCAHLTLEDAQSLSDDLSVLAHPIRLQILDILTHHASQVCVCDLEAALPVKQPTVSHHLKLLRAAGLIDCERHGLWAYYFINRNALRQLYRRVNRQLETLA